MNFRCKEGEKVKDITQLLAEEGKRLLASRLFLQYNKEIVNETSQIYVNGTYYRNQTWALSCKHLKNLSESIGYLTKAVINDVDDKNFSLRSFTIKEYEELGFYVEIIGAIYDTRND